MQARTSRTIAKGVGATAEPHPMSQFLHLNMLEALGRLAEGIYRLKGYTELNHAALYKILRKWDKVLERTDGVSQIYPQMIEGTRIGDMSALEALDANVKEAFSQRSPATNPDISPETRTFRLQPRVDGESVKGSGDRGPFQWCGANRGAGRWKGLLVLPQNGGWTLYISGTYDLPDFARKGQ
eukprot:symbB.v1.2.004060.t1/scaffold229.1/size262426/3